jgi:hypothetical protein
MTEQALTLNSPDDLAQTLERQIEARTWHRIHRLHVDSEHGRVVVHGFAPSYYVKQLALAAVQEVLDARPVELDIQVR